MERRLLAAAPGWVAVGAVVAPGLLIPLVLGSWMKSHGYLIGDFQFVSLIGGHSWSIDPKWALPILGVVVVLWCGVPAGIAQVLLRRMSRRIRNLVTLGLVPLMLVAMWLVVAAQS